MAAQVLFMAFSFADLVDGATAPYDTEPVSYGRSGSATKVREAVAGPAECGIMDRADLERKLEDLHPASFAWAFGCCGRDRMDAEDVLQETYVKILEGKARFDGRSSLKTWLFAVIRTTAASHRRMRWWRELRFVPRDAPPVADAGESAERRLVRTERTSALLRAVGRLARRQREIVELVFYHEMTIEQAAVVAGVSVGTARVHYHRAKQRLLRELNREETP
jgi:RNA polymerase sigma-70 factor, ECF subfamily